MGNTRYLGLPSRFECHTRSNFSQRIGGLDIGGNGRSHGNPAFTRFSFWRLRSIRIVERVLGLGSLDATGPLGRRILFLDLFVDGLLFPARIGRGVTVFVGALSATGAGLGRGTALRRRLGLDGDLAIRLDVALDTGNHRIGTGVERQRGAHGNLVTLGRAFGAC